MKMKAVHVIKFISKTTPMVCLTRVLVSFVFKVFEHLLQGCQTYFHTSEDKDEIVQSLLMGFLEVVCPASLVAHGVTSGPLIG
jgi:hypothetical protein